MNTAAQTRREKRADRIPLDSIKPDGNGGYWVPSSDGKRSYYVTSTSCSCPDFKRRAVICKHRLAVERLCPPAQSVTPEPKPTQPALTAEQELAALDKRLAELLEREKTIGFSRRFRNLNAQTIRHKRARIQERMIELRNQIEESDPFRGF